MSTTTPTGDAATLTRRTSPDVCCRAHRPTRVQGGLLDPKMLLTSLPDAARKLDPRVMVRNPVMFVVEVGAVLSTALAIEDPSGFGWSVVVWLWLTVVFANLAEAVAEGRGKAQAASLRRAKTETIARRLRADGTEEGVPGPQLTPRRPGRGRGRRRSSRATVTSSRASPASTSPRSPASPHRSSASPAVTAARSPAAPRCCPTASSCRSRPSPARASSTG